MGAELTVRVEQPYPDADSALAQAAGGSFAADTYSFLVVAFYASGDSDNDNAGWIKTVPATWENFAVVASNYVTIDWTVPTDANNEERYPNHYIVLCQAASSFTLGSAATKCFVNAGLTTTSIDGKETSATLYSEGTTSKTMDTAATEITLNPILDLKPDIRQQTVRGFDGRLTKKSYAHLNPVNYLDMVLVGTSITNTNYKKILKWILYSTPCRIAESLPGTTETNPLVQYWYGRWIDSPDYIGTLQKNASRSFRLRFEVETGNLA